MNKHKFITLIRYDKTIEKKKKKAGSVMDNQYNYYNPNENSNNEDRQRMNSQSEGSQNGEQKGNTPQWQPGGDHLKKRKKSRIRI